MAHYIMLVQLAMSSALQILVCALVLLGVASEECQSIDRETCNRNVTTLSELINGDFAPNDIVCVDLESNSAETLNYSDTPLTFSVVIRGSNNTVTCGRSPQGVNVDDLTSYTHFPLQFHNSSYVEITGLHFDGCKRPLQFQWIQSIVITSSKFT